MAFDDKLIAMKLRDAYGLTPEQAMQVVGFIAEENQRAYMEGFNNGFEKATIAMMVKETKKAEVLVPFVMAFPESSIQKTEDGKLKIT